MSTTPATPEQEIPEQVAPGQFRERFSADVAEDYNALRAAFRAAMVAKREISVSCRHCGRSSKVEVVDHKAALEAVKLGIEQGFGRAPQAPKDGELLPDPGVPVQEMTDLELDALIFAGGTPEERAADRARLEALLNAVNDPTLSGAQKLDRIDALYPAQPNENAATEHVLRGPSRRS